MGSRTCAKTIGALTRNLPLGTDAPAARLLGLGDFSERALGEFMQRAALVGQAHSQGRLKFGHLSRERCHGPATTPAGPSEAAMRRNEVEVGERGEIHV